MRTRLIGGLLVLGAVLSCSDSSGPDGPLLDTALITGAYTVSLAPNDNSPSLTCTSLSVTVGASTTWTACTRGGAGAFNAARDTLTLQDGSDSRLYRFAEFHGTASASTSTFSGPCTGEI